jgi:hypothetical protein
MQVDHALPGQNSSEVKYGPRFFEHTSKSCRGALSGYGNCRAVETVENEPHVFHRSHRAWKTRHTTPSFPQFPQPLPLEILIKKKRQKTKQIR